METKHFLDFLCDSRFLDTSTEIDGRLGDCPQRRHRSVFLSPTNILQIGLEKISLDKRTIPSDSKRTGIVGQNHG